MSNEQPESSAPLRLFNAFTGVYPEGVTLWPKCYYTLPPEIHNYFFRRIFAGRRGIYQELSSAFFSKLYDECRVRGLVGERACWDKENEAIVAGILRDLNFHDNLSFRTELAAAVAELNACRAELAALRSSVPDAKRSPRKRRASASPDVPPGQP